MFRLDIVDILMAHNLDRIVSEQTGTYVVRVVGKNADLCIVVDSQRPQILDSSDIYPCELSLNILETFAVIIRSSRESVT